MSETTYGTDRRAVSPRALVRMADLLLASPDRGPICDRLALGHRPDAAGVCGHPAHADLPERHPCSLVRLVTLVERLGRARDAA